MIKHIGFDIDGTIADTVNYVIVNFMSDYSKDYGHPYTGRIYWKASEIVDMFPECERSYVEKWVKENMWNKKYYLNVPCRPGVRAVFDWLHRCGVKISIITARYPEEGITQEEIKQYTIEWCKRCKLHVDEFHIGFKDKVSVITANGIELMVEDNYPGAVDIAQKVPVLLVDTEYNKNLTAGNIWHINPTDFDPVKFQKILDYTMNHINKDVVEKEELSDKEQVKSTKISNQMIVLQPERPSNAVILAVPLGSGDNMAALNELKTTCKIKRVIDLSHLNDVQDLMRDSFIHGIILSEKMPKEKVIAMTENTGGGYLLKSEMIKKIIRRAAKLGSTIVYGAELCLLSREDTKEFLKYRMVLLNPSETDEKTVTEAKFKSNYNNFRVLEDLCKVKDGTIYKYKIIKDTAETQLDKYLNRSFITTDGIMDLGLIDGEKPYHPERFREYINMDTYVIGDLHVGRNDKKKLDLIVTGINGTVGVNDTLLILGDFEGKRGSGGLDMVKKCMRRIRCKKVLYILGNNDPWEIKDLVKAGGFLAVDANYSFREGNREVVLTHCPIPLTHNQYNIHGHSHGSHNYWNMDWHNHYDVWDENFKPIKIGKALELIENGSYIGRSQIHDYR